MRAFAALVALSVVIDFHLSEVQGDRLHQTIGGLGTAGLYTGHHHLGQSDHQVFERLVASLAHPGGNVTGLTADTGDEIVGKRFELLKEALPNLSRVGVLWNPDVALNRSRLSPMGETARSLGLTIVPVESRKLDDIDPAFATMSKERVQGFIVQGDSVLYNYRGQIAEAALKSRLPGIAGQKEFADVGFLLAYGADLPDQWRRAAAYVDKIFKGAKPADLPVEQPIKFELLINLKTAKTLGLVVPPSLLARADEVIE